MCLLQLVVCQLSVDYSGQVLLISPASNHVGTSRAGFTALLEDWLGVQNCIMAAGNFEIWFRLSLRVWNKTLPAPKGAYVISYSAQAQIGSSGNTDPKYAAIPDVLWWRLSVIEYQLVLMITFNKQTETSIHRHWRQKRKLPYWGGTLVKFFLDGLWTVEDWYLVMIRTFKQQKQLWPVWDLLLPMIPESGHLHSAAPSELPGVGSQHPK